MSDKQVNGLLGGSPQQQSGMSGAYQNPWLHMGLGLLASSYDPKVNPYQAISSGLQTAMMNRDSQSQIARKEDDRKRMADLREKLSQLIAGRAPGGPGMSPTGSQGAPVNNRYSAFSDYMKNQMLIDQLTGGTQ